MSKFISTTDSISVIVPVYNEIGIIKPFHKELTAALESATRPYEIIYVDDNSTDDTFVYLQKLARQSARETKQTRDRSQLPLLGQDHVSQKVRVMQKIGTKGKAYSLVQGFAEAKGSILAMIDGDLQYPPMAIPEMIEKLAHADIVVANRKNYEAPKLRKTLTRVFKHVFGKSLFDLNTDIQSGLKLFKREVYETIAFTPNSSWTFDLEFLLRAKQAGYIITDQDITFSARNSGVSNVNVLKTGLELGLNSLYVKTKKIKPAVLPTKGVQTMRGAGVGFKKHQYITHTTLPAEYSAVTTFTRTQIASVAAMLAVAVIGFIVSPLLTAQVLVSVLSMLYFIDTVFNLFVVTKSLNKSEEVTVSEEEIARLDESTLPAYTILCPLYKEAHVVPQFLDAISKLEWPKDKLDVMFLLEEDDVETIDAFSKMELPHYARTVVVPHSMPKTKPKACNYGLAFARGEYLVIYDAEDIPDVLQLKKAYLSFQKVPDNVKCLQAKLNFYNKDQNLLTRFFTTEYSLWFDLTLTGLQGLRSTLPLGGTSNHFKTQNLRDLQGWDPFNVTEDADLGIRLFQRGYQTAVIDSTTYEEATSNVKNWLRQRSRWLKGYMQTYLVHTRETGKFVKNHGLKHNLIFQLTVGGKILFILLNPFLWIVTALYFGLNPIFGPIIEAIYVPPVSYLAVFAWIFGNFLFLYYYMIGASKRHQWELMKYIPLIPVYWLLLSIAAMIGFYELLFKPHYWQKTLHGFHLQKKAKANKKAAVVTVPVAPAKPTYAAIINAEKGPEVPFLSEAYLKSFFKRYAIKQSFQNNLRSILGMFARSPRRAVKENKMKILIFNWRDTKHVYGGGAEVYVHELAKRWVKDGNQVTLFAGNDNLSKSREIVDGVEIIRRGGTYTVYLFAMLYYIFKFAGKYDVIIDCENGIPFFTPLFSTKPVVLLVHHVHQEVFRTFLKFPFNHIAALLEGKLMPFVYKNKPIVTVSESSRQEIFKLGFTQEGNVQIIPNGVTEQELIHEKTAHPSFIYLGRLKDYKNIDIAIKAFAKVVKAHPDAKLSIVGSGESFPALTALTEKLRIAHAVEFVGRVSEEAKKKLLAQAWVMLQPSELEGWGITVIEANAVATPVIASRVNGLKDSVIDGETGILAEVRNINQFAEAMNTLIVDDVYRFKLSQNAFIWSKNFNWDKSAAEFHTLLGQSIEGKTLQPAFQKLFLPTVKE